MSIFHLLDQSSTCTYATTGQLRYVYNILGKIERIEHYFLIYPSIEDKITMRATFLLCKTSNKVLTWCLMLYMYN